MPSTCKWHFGCEVWTISCALDFDLSRFVFLFVSSFLFFYITKNSVRHIIFILIIHSLCCCFVSIIRQQVKGMHNIATDWWAFTWRNDMGIGRMKMRIVYVPITWWKVWKKRIALTSIEDAQKANILLNGTCKIRSSSECKEKNKKFFIFNIFCSLFHTWFKMVSYKTCQCKYYWQNFDMCLKNQ